MRILITDVTEMHQGNYCVAGWRGDTGQMVRPLPDGANWTAPLLGSGSVTPGATIGFQVSGMRRSGAHPHLMEDTPINPATIRLISPGPERWFGSGAPPTEATLMEAFGGHIQTTGVWNGAKKGAFIQEGTPIGSLAAVRITCGDLEFFEDNYRGNKSLRAYLKDSDDRYSLPVVGKSLREAYRADGTGGVSRSLLQRGFLHVRVGLARAWPGQPGRCTVMINGVYW